MQDYTFIINNFYVLAILQLRGFQFLLFLCVFYKFLAKRQKWKNSCISAILFILRIIKRSYQFAPKF